MAEPFLAEIRMASFGFAPKGWALCNGQLLAINQNQALFSLLGTVYGGDGRVNFGLPDLQGRTPMHMGGGHTLGERGGEQSHTVSTSEMPQHNHAVNASTASADSLTAVNNFPATPLAPLYNKPDANNTTLSANVSIVGGSQAHENMSPFLVLTFFIALQGIFPSQT